MTPQTMIFFIASYRASTESRGHYHFLKCIKDLGKIYIHQSNPLNSFDSHFTLILRNIYPGPVGTGLPYSS